MTTLILVFFILALICFMAKLFNAGASPTGVQRFDYISAGLASLTIALMIPLLRAVMVLCLAGALFLTGCTSGKAWTPEEATAYANAAHTVIHGAVIDAKDAGEAYNQINGNLAK